MKLISLFVFGAVLFTNLAFSQAPAAAPISSPDIDKALLAIAANLREEATVIKWKADFSYETLKKGTGRLVCYDRSGQPLQQPFSIECTSIGNLERVAQNMKLEAVGDKAKAQVLLDAAEKDGTRVKPEYGSMWFNFMGASEDKARRHTTIAVPGGTTQSTGLPDNRNQGGAWVMNPGTSTAHIMVPGS
ncbi:MAG: hypothetical protein EXQ56_07760 [Acidobacteria bacterium]|nr:hypothetical protein [Acidobacteriota bacterium]